MLKLKNICVDYHHRIIYDHADFCAHHNALTLVMGKSGSGKSTLHQIITFQLLDKCEYYLGDKDISQLSYIQRQEFIKEKMGTVNQVPNFIDDLTVKDHIELCQSLWEGYDINEYIERLEISHILNEYPQQLSGGEKIRVSILLAMIHQPEILVFDEPTASLDQHHSQIIVELLKEYAHQGNIVIIFTHDKLMKSEGDVVYQIEDKILNCIYQNIQNKEVEYLGLNKKYSQHYMQYIYRMFKHKKILKISIIAFVAFAIALSCFSIFYGNSVIDKYSDQLADTNKAGVICRNINSSDITGNLNNYEAPIGEEELKTIQNIKHIDKIWPYIISNDNQNILPNDGLPQFRIFQNQKLIAEREKDVEQQYDLGTYNEEYDYPQKELLCEFDVDEGVYIEKYFLYYLISGEIMNDITNLNQMKFQEAISSINANTEIEFPIFLPCYIEIEDYQEVYYKQITLRMKIKGICSRPRDFELCKEFGTYTSIFVPLRIEEEYRQKISQQVLSSIDLTHYNEYGKVPTSFSPIYYQFSVKEGYTFSEVKEEIESLGYKVVSEYYDKEIQIQVA